MELLVYAFFDRFQWILAFLTPLTPFLGPGGVKIRKLPEVLPKNSLIFPLLFWPFWQFPGVPPGKSPKWPQKGGKNMTNSRKNGVFYEKWPFLTHFWPFFDPQMGYLGGGNYGHFNPNLNCIAVHFRWKIENKWVFCVYFDPFLMIYPPQKGSKFLSGGWFTRMVRPFSDPDILVVYKRVWPGPAQDSAIDPFWTGFVL